MSSEPAITVNHISKEYELGLTGRSRPLGTAITQRLRHPIHGGLTRERFLALDDVSFDVAPGEVVGVIGRNGAGKSTLLKILARITKPSAGHIDMADSVGSLLEVGTGFHPELTGRENVYLNGAILGMSRRQIDRRLDEILAFAEVDKFLETPVKRYSSGMRVRLAFAVAAHLDPEVLIIDEVLSVGDYSFQAKCLEKMRSIATDQGRTVLYVSHNLVTVEHLCPRALLLVAGQLAFDGVTQETVSNYLNLFPMANRNHASGVFELVGTDPSGVHCATEVFKRLALRPGSDVPSDAVRMGEPLRIEIEVEGLNAVADANVSITIGSSTNHCLFRMTSRMMPFGITDARSPSETLVIHIPSVPLTPGDYHVHVAAYEPDGTVIEEVHRAAEFSVIAADVLGTGYHFTPTDGQFTVPWNWELLPSTRESLIGSHGVDGVPAGRDVERISTS